MALLTIVRSHVGRRLDLPGGVSIRPWHFVELKSLTDEQKAALKILSADKTVQVSQLRGRTPLDTVDLSIAPPKGE